MQQLREMIMILTLVALASCQTNYAGKPGYVPTNCSVPGSSCDLERPLESQRDGGVGRR
jgi:hypothetical protein